MTDDDKSESRVQTGARTGTRTWPVGGARAGSGAASGATWPGFEFAIPARVREWAAAEIAAGRLLPWLAVAYGAGIVLYFTAEREPRLWAAVGLAVICAAGAVLLRRHVVGFVVALGVAAAAPRAYRQ